MSKSRIKQSQLHYILNGKNKKETYSCIYKLLPFVIILWIDMVKFPKYLYSN